MLLLRASYDPGNMLIFSSQRCYEVDAAIIPILHTLKLNSKRLNHLANHTQPGSRKARWLSKKGVPPQAIGRTCSLPVACHHCCCTCFAISSGPSNEQLFTLRSGLCPTGKGQSLSAIPRPEHTEPLRVGQPQPRAQAAWLQVAPQLSLFILTFPLYWWLLRVLPKLWPNVSGKSEPNVNKYSSGCSESCSYFYFLFPWDL